MKFSTLQLFRRYLCLSAVLIMSTAFGWSAETRLLFLGDSLTAGYGLDEQEAFPALLQTQFDHAGLKVTCINAGISGDTTAGGRGRVEWTLQQKPTHVLIALGGNDGLRGFPPSVTRKNLTTIIESYQNAGCTVYLAGMQMPPSHGETFRDEFNAIFSELAKELHIPLYPFLLDGVGGEAQLNQADGIHPNKKGQQVIADRLGPWLQEQLAPQDKSIEKPEK